MAKDPIFPLYTQDFLVGTTFMTNEEVGIYIKLLCYQHQHGGLIDKDDFNSMVNESSRVRKKFIEVEEGFYNERLMKEMAKRQKVSNNLSLNAQKRWESKCNANAMQEDMPSDNENEIEIENKYKKVINNSNKVKSNIFDFSLIWEKYPNKVGKKDAERHFKATVKTEEDFNKISTALENYLKSKRVYSGFIQNGSTWFNNWQDWIQMPDTEKICSKCKGKGKFTSTTGFEIICDCPAGRSK